MAKAKKSPSSRYKNTPFLRALGSHCKRIRVQKGYSIDRMWREGDKLSPGAIQRLENGTHDVHVSVFYRYAEVLEVSLKYLFDFEK
jgi:transcriptional regulator with XRE-family HTH domain